MMGFFCCVLFVFVVESQRHLFVTVIPPFVGEYRIRTFTSEYQEGASDALADEQAVLHQSEFRAIADKHKWVRVSRGDGKADLNFDVGAEPITRALEDLFIQACIPRVDCLSKHLFYGKNGGESIVISGKGLTRDAKLNLRSLQFKVGSIMVDGKYFRINVFSFVSEFQTLKDKNVDIQLEGLYSGSQEVEDGGVTVKKYSAPEFTMKDGETEKVMITIMCAHDNPKPLFMIGVCSKESITSECNKGHDHTRMHSPSNVDEINLMLPYEDRGIYYEISVYLFVHGYNKETPSELEQIPVWSLRGLGSLLDENIGLPCAYLISSLFYCHMIKCHAGNSYCKSPQKMVQFTVKVKSADARTTPVLIDGVRYDESYCEISESTAYCELNYSKVTAVEVHKISFKSCVIFLMKGKPAAFDMCSDEDGLHKLVITRS